MNAATTNKTKGLFLNTLRLLRAQSTYFVKPLSFGISASVSASRAFSAQCTTCYHSHKKLACNPCQYLEDINLLR